MSETTNTTIGNASTSNFWLHHPTHGYDLTHPTAPDAPLIHPRIPLQTTTSRVTIDPAKTALVIIDMQNFFLSPQLGRSTTSEGLKACEKLLKHAIPAARKAGIRIVWLNWGLTDDEIGGMPPATLKAFGFESASVDSPACGSDVKDSRLYKGLGSELGPVKLEDGSTVEGGKLLMRDQWNAALYAPLEAARQGGMDGKCANQDIWLHKNRMSGLWGPGTAGTEYLEAKSIRTLLFAGVNTDQCVGGTLQDAFTKGYDCLLLSDGCGTTSPAHSQQCVEFNAAKTWGFVLSCEDVAKGVEDMVYS